MLNIPRSKTQIYDKVFVYRNLTKSCWSIKSCQGEDSGKVTGHASWFILKDVDFKVSEAGRQRVILEKRKNVHAGLIGTLVSVKFLDGQFLSAQKLSLPEDFSEELVQYNPYQNKTFIKSSDGSPIVHSLLALGDDIRPRIYSYESKELNLGQTNNITY